MIDSIPFIKGIFELNDDDLQEIATLLPAGQHNLRPFRIETLTEE